MNERNYPQYDNLMLRGQAAVDTERSILMEEFERAKSNLRKKALLTSILLTAIPLAEFLYSGPRFSLRFILFEAFALLGGLWSMLSLTRRMARARKKLEMWSDTSNDMLREFDRTNR